MQSLRYVVLRGELQDIPFRGELQEVPCVDPRVWEHREPRALDCSRTGLSPLSGLRGMLVCGKQDEE